MALSVWRFTLKVVILRSMFGISASPHSEPSRPRRLTRSARVCPVGMMGTRVGFSQLAGEAVRKPTWVHPPGATLAKSSTEAEKIPETIA